MFDQALCRRLVGIEPWPGCACKSLGQSWPIISRSRGTHQAIACWAFVERAYMPGLILFELSPSSMEA